MSTTLSKDKTIIAKLCGLHSHIVDLERQIRDLSWDKSFDMWTKNAFLQFCSVMPRGCRAVAFIDIDDVHGLNHKHGYQEVDRRIRAMFAIPWRGGDIVARWYSGDEFVVLFDNHGDGPQRKIEELRASAESNGLAFVCELGTWDVGRRTITTVIGELSDSLQRNNPGTTR